MKLNFLGVVVLVLCVWHCSNVDEISEITITAGYHMFGALVEYAKTL